MIRDPERQARLIADIRRFVRELAIPNEDRVERENAMPAELVDAMRKLGSFGWSIPEEYGGAALTTEELAGAFMELSRASVAFRVIGATNAGIGSQSIIEDGSEAQKEKYLPKLASGEIYGCLALTEPEAGSDATSLQATARRTSEGWILDGEKRYITMAPLAHLFTVFARTDPGNKGAGGVSAFLVERGTPGLTVKGPTPMMGQEGAPIGEVFLRDCRIPASALLGKEGEGFRTVMKTLNKQRVNLASLCTGPAIRMLDEALAYVRERRQFGAEIGTFQLVQAMLADCKVEIEAARALILETARKRDRGEDVALEVSMCKYYATEMCGRVADRVVQIFGGQGYVKGRGIERFYRDVRAFRIYEGTSQIHQLNIAKLLLKKRG